MSGHTYYDPIILSDDDLDPVMPGPQSRRSSTLRREATVINYQGHLARAAERYRSRNATPVLELSREPPAPVLYSQPDYYVITLTLPRSIVTFLLCCLYYAFYY